MMRSVLVLLLCTAAAFSQSIVIFRGIPSVRVVSTPERDDREKLEGEAAQKAECVIVERGKNKYFWQSRNNTPLHRVDTAQFTYFLHTEGLGYVKVFTGQRSANPSTAEYLESFTRGLEVTTYWGIVQNPGQ